MSVFILRVHGLQTVHPRTTVLPNVKWYGVFHLGNLFVCFRCLYALGILNWENTALKNQTSVFIALVNGNKFSISIAVCGEMFEKIALVYLTRESRSRSRNISESRDK